MGGLWYECWAWTEPDICEALIARQIGAPSETQTMQVCFLLVFWIFFPLDFMGLLLSGKTEFTSFPVIGKSSSLLWGSQQIAALLRIFYLPCSLTSGLYSSLGWRVRWEGYLSSLSSFARSPLDSSCFSSNDNNREEKWVIQLHPNFGDS